MDFPEIEIDDFRIVPEVRLRFIFRLRLDIHADILARKRRQEASKNGHQSHAAAVYDARFFEDGEKFGSHGERLVALRDDVREKLLKIFLSRRGFARVFAHHADDGENGAFLGNGYGAVGDLGARFHRLCKNLRVEFFSAFADHRTDPP